MRMEMIRLEHVTKSFGRYKALDDVSIVVEEGEFLTVIGRSGCGKTTMLRMINGLQKPDSGKVYAAGEDVGEADLIRLRRKIGYVIQNKGLFPHMTVEKNIIYVPVISGQKDKRQNRLREGENGEPNDIQKIVETYQFRKEEPRYSKRISLERIEQEDFNLNITRYVSTAQDEEPIDLKKVNEELNAIAKKSKEALNKHNQYLQELGLPLIND